MDIPSISDLLRLAKHDQEPCVSIFIPTHKKGGDPRQDRILFKNMYRRCLRELEIDEAKHEIPKWLKPVGELVEDDPFWSYQFSGLAAFAAPGYFDYYRVPITLHEQLYVEPGFNIKPLIPLYTSNTRFFILAMSQKHIRLYECTSFDIHEVSIPDLPENIEEYLQYVDTEETIQVHSAPANKTTGTGAVYHGQGAAGDKKVNKKTRLLQFLLLVDQKLKSLLADENAPLVLAGNEPTCTMFKNHTAYSETQGTFVTGNPDLLDTRQLHGYALELLRDRFEHLSEHSTQMFYNADRKHQASRDIREILPLADQGRVGVLYVNPDKMLAGDYAKDKSIVRLGDECPGASRDLINQAIVYAILNRAEIYTDVDNKVLEDAPLACIYRY